MMQSRIHVAAIMDGNGRWAQARGLPRPAGHAAGAEALRHIVETAAAEPVQTLTVYAFSADNWKRPAGEVAMLMALLAEHLRTEAPRCVHNDIRVSVMGRRDRLPRPVCDAIEACEHETAHCGGMHLRLAIDYSARESILAAAHSPGLLEGSPDVDLLIRTGGEQRLSDFLLWECAYAELYFTQVLWPDFQPAGLRAALRWYASRERRFGGIPGSVPPVRTERWLL